MEDLYLNIIKEASGSKLQNLRQAAQCAYGKQASEQAKGAEAPSLCPHHYLFKASNNPPFFLRGISVNRH